MSVSVSGQLVLECTDENEKAVTITVPAQDIFIDDPEVQDSDRGMGVEYVYRAEAAIPNHRDVEWLIYEYPEGCLNMVDGPKTDCDVIQEPVFSIRK